MEKTKKIFRTIIFWIIFVLLMGVLLNGRNIVREFFPTNNENHYNLENINFSNNNISYNPYQEGSGHYAGYEWAKEKQPYECGGNSQSFIEGCQRYLDDN